MAQQSVLVISVSAGSGHVRAAEALVETCSGYDSVEIRHIDVLTTVSRSFRGLYADLYRHLIQHAPALWAYLYKKTDLARSSDLGTILRRFIERICTRRLIRQVREFRPDHIICTHFMPAELLSRELREERLQCKLWVQVTDFDLHSLWVHEGVTGYFVATDEVAFKLAQRGVPASRIRVTGIPVNPVFLTAPQRQVARQELSLDQERRTVLLLSGGKGVGSVPDIAARLLEQQSAIQIIAIAGKNQDWLRRLQQLAELYPGQLVALGYSRVIERLMAASDMVVTKPGGLTSSECLVMGLPMILVDPIPGQEERNSDYLLERGSALKAHDLLGLDFKVRHLCESSGQLAAMRIQLLHHAHPLAAREVLNTVLGRN